MNKLAALLVVAIVLGAGASAATSHPFGNVAFDDNTDGWFTTSNLEAYGDDLDQRIEGQSGYVFTGHPAYVMDSQKARLLFDMPRIHYFAIMWNNTQAGNQMYANLTVALRDGRAKWAINNTMTDTLLEKNETARNAFNANYCRVDDPETRALYNRTDATLYRWVGNESACPEAEPR